MTSTPKRVSMRGNTYSPHVVACPYCGSKGGVTCYSAFGTEVTAHPSRIESFHRAMDIHTKAFERESRLRRHGML